jgi:adenosine deaminase
MSKWDRASHSGDRGEDFYHSLPKVDLHRHLEGSLRFETVRELARSQRLDLPETAELRTMVQMAEQETYTFDNFLSKFSTLRLFYRSPEIIGRITREAIADAAADNVRYLELRFTPVALSRVQNFGLAQVMDWVIQGAREAEANYGVKTRLIASVNRHEEVALAAQVAYLAIDRVDQGIVGLDLAGDEVNSPAGPFVEIFKYARKHGLHTTVHAGEWGSPDNILQALLELGAERIGHGVRVMESRQVQAVALEKGTVFEVCVTSNFQSGVVEKMSEHPLLQMISRGLKVTLNTDDPGISKIDLSHEYRLVCETFGLGLKDLRDLILEGAGSAFLPREERESLVGEISAELDEKI